MRKMQEIKRVVLLLNEDDAKEFRLRAIERGISMGKLVMELLRKEMK